MVEAPARVAVVVEDDDDIRRLLQTVLVRSGFEVVLTADGPSGLEAVREYDPLVTTLDVSMPGMDGFAVAREIRTFSSTYVIVITGLGEEIDVVQGLEAGADDYLIKPFRPRELRARIETMLRRPRERVGAPAATEPPAGHTAGHTTTLPVQAPASQPAAAAPAAHPHLGPEVLESDGLRLHPAERLVSVDGRPVELTRTEFDLLASLLASGSRVRSKSDLVLTMRGQTGSAHGAVGSGDKRAVEVHLSNLRRKIGDSSALPRWIETVHGVGYRMVSP